MVHSLQSQVFNRIVASRLAAGLTLSSPTEGDIVGIIQDTGKIDMGKLVEVENELIDRLSRNCRLGRLAVTGALPGGDNHLSSGKPGDIERSVISEMQLLKQDWKVIGIPRLTSKGSRRPITVQFSDFSVEQAGDIEPERLSPRMIEGPRDGEQWHPDGCSLRLRFSLPSGTYATVLMREFMRAPLTQY